MPQKFTIYFPEPIRTYLNFTAEKMLPSFKEFENITVAYATTKAQFLEEVVNTDYIVTLTLKPEVYEIAKNLKAVFTCMAGKESVAQPPNDAIQIFHGRFHGELMAESLVGNMLYFNQKIQLVKTNQTAHAWSGRDELGKRHLLRKQKVAIIGYGAIGKCCAKLLSGFRPKIYAFQRTHSNGSCSETGAEYQHISELNSLLPEIDHIVSILPATAETNHFFDETFFSQTKPSAYFYNLGRGNSVDESALLSALKHKQLAGAALDVFHEEPLPSEFPLWGCPDILITPHTSAFYQEYVEFFLEELKLNILSVTNLNETVSKH